MQLTERQEEMLAFISGYQRDQKVPPSTRIIQKYFALSSQTAAARHLEALATKGVLEQVEGDAWQANANEIQAVFELSLPSFAEHEDGAVGREEGGVIRTCAP